MFCLYFHLFGKRFNPTELEVTLESNLSDSSPARQVMALQKASSDERVVMPIDRLRA